MSHPDPTKTYEDDLPYDNDYSDDFPIGGTIEPYDIHREQMQIIVDGIKNLKEN